MSSSQKPFDFLSQKKKLLKCSADRGVVVRFIKDLSVLVNAAVPLVKGLEVLARQHKEDGFGQVLQNLAKSVHSGMSFSTSLMKYPKIFDAFFVNMVKAGEASCNLGEVLVHIAKHKEKELKLRRKMRSVMAYPMIVISIAAIIVSLLFLFIIPKFESVFSTAFSETAVPLATRMIIALSHSFHEIAIFLLIAFGGLLLAVRFVKKPYKDKWILKIPVMGNIIRDVNIALFSRILGTLIASGVPLIEALRVGENIASNHAIRSSLKNARSEIEDGEAFSAALEHQGQFPEIPISMIRVGEETATLSSMLLEVANKLEDDSELALESLTSVLEPVMTLLLAVIIGAIVIALWVPIVNVMNNVIVF